MTKETSFQTFCRLRINYTQCNEDHKEYYYKTDKNLINRYSFIHILKKYIKNDYEKSGIFLATWFRYYVIYLYTNIP